jgi:hypothetical protein
MDYCLTIFKNRFDNETHKRMNFEKWEYLENTFLGLSKAAVENKHDAYLISPAIYEPNTTRRNVNVTAWAGWCAVDVDEHEFKGDLKQELNSIVPPEWYYMCYSTASSTEDKPKFRLVFKLDKHVPADKIKHFWHALNTEIGNLSDRQTKDLSRMYYIPADYSGSYSFFFTRSGGDIGIDSLLSKHPYIEKKTGNNFLDRLPEELQKEVIAHRKTKLENKNKYNWNGIYDCPFVNKQMLAEYRIISETGWYHKMYQFMVSLAFNAIRKGYPITDSEIEILMRELDRETGNWYEKRPIKLEANSAIEYAYRNSEVI